MSSFRASLTPSASALQQAERPGPVRAGPRLHPAHHPALRPDHDQCRDDQEDEDGQRLAEHHPAVVLAEVGGRVLARQQRGGHESGSLGHRGASLDSGAGRARRDRHDGAAVDAERRAHRAAGGVRRQPDDPVGHRRDDQRQRDRAAGRRHRHAVRRRPRRSPRPSPTTSGPPGTCRGPGQVRLAVLQPAVVEQQVPGREDRGRRAAAAAGRRSAPREPRRARPPRHRARRARRARARPRAGRPGRPSRRRARPARAGPTSPCVAQGGLERRASAPPSRRRSRPSPPAGPPGARRPRAGSPRWP